MMIRGETNKFGWEWGEKGKIRMSMRGVTG